MPNKTFPVLKAEHQEKGVWLFQCFACRPKKESTAISSPVDALKVLRNHADRGHPGLRVRLIRESQYSGSVNKLYTGENQASRSVMAADEPGLLQ